MAVQISERLVDTNEAAQILRLAPGTLNNLRCKNRGPDYLKYGNRVRYRMSDLVDFLELKKVVTKIK